MSRIGFTVLGGYLGSGKTTVLNHWLRHNDGRRLALLINDFGDINLDAELIESTTEQQINLANGCVCCSLSDGFFEALERLQQLHPRPDQIIVEASGVADVANLAQYGYGQDFRLTGVIVVVDAETVRAKADDKYVAQTVRRQLQSADLLVVNKIDLLPTPQLAEVREWLAALTPGTPMIDCSYGRVPPSVLLDAAPQHAASLPPAFHAHEDYVSWHWESQHPTSRDRLEDFARRLPTGVLRAKGLFGHGMDEVLELQVVGRRRDIYRHAGRQRHHNTVIAIGLKDQLDLSLLDAAARQSL